MLVGRNQFTNISSFVLATELGFFVNFLIVFLRGFRFRAHIHETEPDLITLRTFNRS